MTLIIELPDNLQTALKAQATAQGISEEGYVRTILERDLAGSDRADSLSLAGAAEKARLFELWARSHPDTPPLSDEAIRREHLIRDA